MITVKHAKQDFSDAKYNVLDIGLQKVLEAFPDLERFPEFKVDYKELTKLNNESVLKYVLLMYMDNVLRKSIPDLDKRKKEAALLAGFEISEKTRRFHKKLESIMLCEDVDVNRLIVRVIRMNNSSAFEQIAVYEEARARQMVKLLSPSTGDEKTKEIHENIRRMTADIDNLEKKLLMEEKSKTLTDVLYYEIENFQLGIHPEEIAEAKKAGALDSVLFNVYAQSSPEMENVNLRKRRRKKDA